MVSTLRLAFEQTPDHNGRKQAISLRTPAETILSAIRDFLTISELLVGFWEALVETILQR